MRVEQIYTNCLAEAAYYIESKGEVAIIDPLRESRPYLERADRDHSKIKYVFETHFHADFVSGHLDLARKTGATIVFGPTAQPNYEAHIAQDGEEFELGDVKIKVLHTPGHTMESSTFLLIDNYGNDRGIFTGDTLFIGDVGRPDLAVKTDLTEEDLAGHLFDSLRNKIMPLGDDVIVYPGHGKGSACGKMMSDMTTDTLGNQKMFNYALRADMTREEFIEAVLDGLAAPPQYFPKDATLNKMGYEGLDKILERGTVAFQAKEFKQMIKKKEAVVVDSRHKEDFAQGFIPDSIFIGLEDNFAPWVGALIEDLQQPILFVADPGTEEEVITRLSRVGYDNPIGYLEGGTEAWASAGFELHSLEHINVAELENMDLAQLDILDVRRQSEFEAQHIEGATNFPLDFAQEQLDELDPDKKYYLHCEGGYRSAIACSVLKANGFKDLVNIDGGFKEISQTSIPTTEYVAPTTML